MEDLNEDLYENNIINFVRPVYTPILKGGIAVSQGDKAIQSDNARLAFDVDGTDVKICVMSDSYNAKQKAQKDYDNGDLSFVDVSEDYSSDFGSHFYVVDEGRAMLQIINDIAPGAELGFRTGFVSIEHMANGIHILQSEHGCDMIVDDITHLSEPFYKDGLISDAVNEVTDLCVKYFSSAGNFRDWGYESKFSPATGSESFHHFNDIDGIEQQVEFREAGTYIIVLQWDDMYKSLGGIDNTGARNDLDISIIDSNNNNLVSLKSNNLGGDPIEVMPFKVKNGGAKASIVIERTSGMEDVNFKYIVFVGGGYFSILHEPSSVSTIVGQANAVGAYTVGAASYDQTPAFGVDPPVIEDFSSHGGTEIGGVDRKKPDFIAPDRVNTSVTTIGTDIDGDVLTNFIGTSAAAPHAAAVAALISQAITKFDETGIDVGETMKNTALSLNQSGEYDKITGNGFILADKAIMSFANPKPSIKELVIPSNKTPGKEAFKVTIKGKNLTGDSEVRIDGSALPDKMVTFEDDSTMMAVIDKFTGDPQLQVFTPAITISGDDGGLSNPMSFFYIPKTKITVKANNDTKLFGEVNPEFSATLFVDGDSLHNSSLDLAEIDRLTSIGFLYKTSSKHWSDTEGQYCSPIGNYYINPTGINPATIDPNTLGDYEFEYLVDDKAGKLTIKKMPLTIKPIIENDFVYGEKIEDIPFDYDLYSDGSDDNDNIDNLNLLLEYIELEHTSTFRDGITNAILDRGKLLVNRGKLLVNRGKLLVNEFGWLVSDAALSNRGKLLVNGNISIDIDIDILTDYTIYPEGTLSNRGKLLVNGESLLNGEAGERDELGNRGKLLVNEGGLLANESESEEFSNITLIVDTGDFKISNIYSVNLISGLEVNPPDGDPQYEGSPHYILPGAFFSAAADNFEITYIDVEFDITPAELLVSADSKLMFFKESDEEAVMPKFTSTYDGFQYEDNEDNVFSSITYLPTEVTSVGEYSIIPTSFNFLDDRNYTIPPPTPAILTVKHLTNGRIAVATQNGDFYDLTLINSDGSDPATLVSVPESVPGSVRDPEFSPDGMEVVFASDNGDATNLWKINSSGSGLTPLTSDGVSSQADFSPNGGQIAFIKNGDIAIMNSDGSGPKIILETPGNERWPFYSHDGEELYFTRDTGDGNNEIYKINLGPARSNLISWWPGNGNVQDVEHSNHGMFQGGATFEEGYLNQAFQFDGIDDFVMVPDGPGLNFGADDFTIDLWVNFASADGEQVLIEKWIQKYEENSTGWTLTKLDGNVLRLAMQDRSGPEVVLDQGPLSISAGEWNHVAVTREGNIFTMYWNGTVLGFLDCPYNLNSVSSLKMGHRGNQYDTPGSDSDQNFYLDGSIDEVKIYDRALSPQEILTIMEMTETLITSNGIFYRQPDILRDGSKIVYTRSENASADGNAVMTMEPDGTDQVSIFNDLVGSASGAPDSEKIVFNNQSDQLRFLRVMNMDGSEEQVIYVQDNLELLQPNWGTYPDSYVSIPDENFEQALIDLGWDNESETINGRILRSDAEAVFSLDVSDPVTNPNLPNVSGSIRDLTGIEEFVNLRRLYCQYNQLTDLDLSQNTELIQLWCHNNQITELDFSSNPALNDILCYENRLTRLDITQNNALTHLNCYGNQLDILDVSSNNALIGFSCYDNNISVLDISHNTELVTLDCAGNLLDNLDVSANTKLTFLSCPFNRLNSLNVSTNTSLEHLLVAGNKLTGLDISSNTSLLRLYCEGNQLETLNVTNNTALNEIRCNHNLLTELNVTQNTALNFLECQNNHLIELILTYNTKLLQLQCGSNQLTELDVSTNIMLDNITCYDNRLTSLDLSTNIALNALYCHVNQLTSLDLSRNTELVHMYCFANQLTSLDLRNGSNESITIFQAHDNNLTCINVNDETVDYRGEPYNWVVDSRVSFSNDCELRSQLIAHYPFDGDANDMSGNEHNGTVVGASLTTDRFGIANSSYSFDGVDNKIWISDHPDFDFTDKVTISAWFKPVNSSGHYIVKKAPDSGGGGPYSLDYYYGTPRTVLHNESNAPPLALLIGSSSIQVGVWQHIAFTYDGSTVTLYYNGQVDASVAATGILQQSTGSVDIGVYDWSDLYYEGDIDDIYFYNYALTDSEVEDLYNHGGWPVTGDFASSSILPSTIVQGDITVYPNPVINFINIIHQDKDATLEVVIANHIGDSYDLSGDLIKTIDGYELDLSDFVPGIYILRISDNKTLESFIIQKD